MTPKRNPTSAPNGKKTDKSSDDASNCTLSVLTDKNLLISLARPLTEQFDKLVLCRLLFIGSAYIISFSPPAVHEKLTKNSRWHQMFDSRMIFYFGLTLRLTFLHPKTKSQSGDTALRRTPPDGSTETVSSAKAREGCSIHTRSSRGRAVRGQRSLRACRPP